MDILMEKGIVKELACGQNFSYILNDKSTLSLTEYKVLQSQGNSSLIKCMKITYNGKIGLYYETSGYKSFRSLLRKIDDDQFMLITTNLLSEIISVKENGFLNCSNIDISFDKIFIEPSTYKVKLIYLPISVKTFSDYNIFENELRTSLVKLIGEIPNIRSLKTSQFKESLIDGHLNLEDLPLQYKKAKIQSTVVNDKNKVWEPETQTKKARLKLVAKNTPQPFELLIDKNEYVIGRLSSAVDGVISFNKAIGKLHCKIIIQRSGCAIVDLNSKNKTYVNGVMLTPNIPVPLNNGDTVRLANLIFKVYMG